MIQILKPSFVLANFPASSSSPPPPSGSFEYCSRARWKWELCPHLETEEADDEFVIYKNLLLLFLIPRRKKCLLLKPAEVLSLEDFSYSPSTPEGSLGLLLPSGNFLFFEVGSWRRGSWKKLEVLRFAFCQLPLLLFFLLSFLLIVCFDDVCFWRRQVLLGMSVAIEMPGGKKFCRNLLKLLLKSC